MQFIEVKWWGGGPSIFFENQEPLKFAKTFVRNRDVTQETV